MLDVVHVKGADDDAEGTNGLHTKLLSRITYRKIVSQECIDPVTGAQRETGPFTEMEMMQRIRCNKMVAFIVGYGHAAKA